MYLIAKLFAFILVPANWVWLLLILITIFRKKRWVKKLYFLLFAIIIIGTNPFLHHWAVWHWQTKTPALPNKQQYGAIILLGGMVGFDKENRGYFGFTADRFLQTAKLYHSGYAPTIIVAGGSNNILRKQPAEADFVANELIATGIKKEAIFIENKSVNTFENAKNSKRLIDSLHLLPPYLLVSSAVHLPRATQLFEKLNLKVVPHAAAYDAIPQKWYFTDAIIPSISLLDKWGSLLKEISGLYIYKLSGKA